MPKMNCTNEDKYSSKDGRCCDRCPAGTHLKTECDATKVTQCASCERGRYTATKNHLTKCYLCKECSSNNNQRKVNDCTAVKDTVCECLTGFYCNNDDCDHCQPVADCPLGEGVKFQATRTNNTVCAPCEEGTFSNVTDFHSPCRAHTRCEDYGRVLKTQGTPTTDAICGNFKFHCPWMLPAGLWSGLVLTILVVLVLILWRAKRKSYRAARHKSELNCHQTDIKATGAVCSGVPVSLADMVPPPPATPPVLPSHCQESCTMDDCKISLFNSDETPVSCSIEDSLDSTLPITPLKASVSFAESNHVNGSAGYCTGNFLRSYSEPQEDEWCGT